MSSKSPAQSPDSVRDPSAPEDAPAALARDVALVERISAVPGILEILCNQTRMGFAAVARVTDGTWTACAVRDLIAFGLKPGGQLDVHTTLCKESRTLREPVAFDHASRDPAYRNHHTPRIYGIESYVSVPIVLPNGDYFGNLCAIDPKPASVANAQVLSAFQAFAKLIATEIARAQREGETESALKDEREVSVLREQFIAVLGHDLRNPLAAVFASADLLVRKGSEVDVAAVGKRIQSSARRMTRLIDDVMDFARGRLGGGIGTRLAWEEDPGAFLREVVVEARASYPDREIVAQIDVAQAVRCDRARLQQLLSNLLGNALHHGAADRPVRVEARTDADEMVIAVINEGAAIPPEHMGKLFEPYWRPPSSEPGGGLGLGLHICSQIAAAHGGRMEVSSSREGVTRFAARLPLTGC
jgi:signal transduction histidine kinase